MPASDAGVIDKKTLHSRHPTDGNYKIKKNLSPLFYKALVSGAVQREEEHENLRGTAGGTKQAGRMHAALCKGRQMSSVADTKTREPGDFSSSSRKWRQSIATYSD